MYDDYYDKKKSSKNNDPNIVKILNLVVLAIIIIIFIVIILWILAPSETTEEIPQPPEENKYLEYEEKLKMAATSYFASNILSSAERYVTAATLNVQIPSNCSMASGVIFSGNLNLPYLLCSDYESTVFDPPKDSSITLVGRPVYIILKGTEFTDPGYVSPDHVTVTGNIGTEEGVYNIIYMGRGSNDTVTRKVIVTDDEKLKNVFPTIKLKGEDNIYILKNSRYVDLGVDASDPVEGDISRKVNRSGQVRTDEVGEYKITYSVSNNSGLSVSTTRTITVVNDVSELEIVEEVTPKEKTNQAVTIKLKVLGENYAYSYLPTGEKTEENEYSYTVNDNAIYHFWVYDKYGRYTEKKITVNNIDKATPTFTCDANVYGNRVEIIVTSISKPISKYKYIVNGNASKYLEQTSYVKYTNDFKTAVVEVVDQSGNTSTGGCNSVQKDPYAGNNNIKIYNYGGAEYVVANTKNDLDTFVSMTRGKISQSVFSDKNDPNHDCTNQCLGFSLYHAGYIQIGDLSKMDALKACHYNTIKSMTHTFYQSKEETLNKVYNEITSGNVCVLQVTGTSKRNSRHFVLVVGFRRDKYSAADLREEDLLTIDSWTGNFCTLSESDLSKRTMFFRGGQGYRVDHF